MNILKRANHSITFNMLSINPEMSLTGLSVTFLSDIFSPKKGLMVLKLGISHHKRQAECPQVVRNSKNIIKAMKSPCALF